MNFYCLGSSYSVGNVLQSLTRMFRKEIGSIWLTTFSSLKRAKGKARLMTGMARALHS